MGFGHRVYKNYDPRAKLMRETCHEVLNELGLHNDPLFKLAMALEKIALEDDYFVQRKLYPNVDFYSGIVQRAIGIPVAIFTGIFALARTVGWIAQWNEMIADPEYKIGRPRQLYTGATRREVKPIARTQKGQSITDHERVQENCSDPAGIRVGEHGSECAVPGQLLSVRRQRAVRRGAVRELPGQSRQSVPDNWRDYFDALAARARADGVAATWRTRRSSIVRRARKRGAVRRRRTSRRAADRAQAGRRAAADRRVSHRSARAGPTSIRSSARSGRPSRARARVLRPHRCRPGHSVQRRTPYFGLDAR